ncbi:MAG: hypothetical protein ABI925_07930, partial [Verrucomicrobiota bacterium]
MGLAVWLSASGLLRGADLSQLRAQLKIADEAGDKSAVIELGRRILATAPKENAIWEKVARAQIEIPDFERCGQTLDAWEKAVKPPPAAIEDFRGDLAMNKKDYESAERHWLTFLARKPSRAAAADVYDKLADMCADQARWVDHEKYRGKAITAEDSVERRVTHATALLRLHQWDPAYAEMAKANKTDSTNAQVKEWLPQFERLATFLPRIKALDAQLSKSPDDVDLLLDRARVFTEAERPLLALDDCERVMKLRPASMRVRIQTAEALLDNQRPDDAAKLQVSPSLAREKDTHVSEQELRDLATADAQIAQDPKQVGPFAVRAKILRELRQYALALADAKAAVALDDKSAAAHFEIAHDLDELDQKKEALAHGRTATDLDPNDWMKWCFLGMLEKERADFPAAIESLTRSVKLQESLLALREREQCERQTGQIEKADADAKRITELE